MHIWKQTHENIVHQRFNLIDFVLSLCVIPLLKGFCDMFKDTMETLHWHNICDIPNKNLKSNGDSDLSNQKPIELEEWALNSLIH